MVFVLRSGFAGPGKVLGGIESQRSFREGLGELRFVSKEHEEY
jgi:hypothetical protein